MSPAALRVLYWAPRVLAIAFAAFLSLFALDVFAGQTAFSSVLADFALHLLPAGVVLAALALAWHWEWTGAASFPALALAYLVFAWGRFPWTVYAVISGPLLLIGLLFALGRRAPRAPDAARPASARG